MVWQLLQRIKKKVDKPEKGKKGPEAGSRSIRFFPCLLDDPPPP